MTGNNILVMHAIEGLLWVGALAIVVYWPWQKVCVDYARDVVFEQRDNLFDIAARGDIEFGSEPYEKMRASMNAMIRLAHSFTIPRMFICMYIMKRSPNRTHRQELLDVSAEIENPEVRKAFEEALQTTESAMLFMMLLRSPLTIFGTLIFVRPLSSLRRKAERLIARPLEAVIGHEADGIAH
jgi:hypothetical protein